MEASTQIKFRRAKLIVASVIIRPTVGRVVRKVFRERIPFRGKRIDTANPRISDVTPALLFWRMYESAESRFAERYVPRDMDVIELGSSIGAVSSLIGSRLDHGRRMICVEANPALIPTLKSNIARNCAHLSTEVINVAVAYDRPGGTVEFEFGTTNFNGRLVDANDGRETVTVPTATLSEVIAENGISDYFLVIDIDGAELPIFQRDKEALSRCSGMVIEADGRLERDGVLSIVPVLELIASCGFTLQLQYGNVCHFSRTYTPPIAAT